MFSKKKDGAPERSGKGKALAAQLGLYTDMEAMENAIYGGDDDAALEAELLQLTQENEREKKPAKVGTTSKIPPELMNLDKMITDSLRDYPSDEEVSDTEDPELLAELEGLEGDYEPPSKTTVPPSQSHLTSAPSGASTELLHSRLRQYQQAHANAKAAGDSSKARRIDRGLKTLGDLLKKVAAGKTVAEDEIPPEVSTGTSQSVPGNAESMSSIPANSESSAKSTPISASQSSLKKEAANGPSSIQAQTKPVMLAHAEPPASLSSDKKETWLMLHKRQEQFREAALAEKQKGNKEPAAKYLRTYKQFEGVLTALENNEEIDLSRMPPPPPGYEAPAGKITTESLQTSSVNTQEENLPEISAEDKQKLFQAPAAARSVEEALNQRLTKYQQAASDAQEENNSSKVRRMKRIVTQYQTALKDYKAGKQVNFEELPTPPGYPPIPVQSAGNTSRQGLPGGSSATTVQQGGTAAASSSVPSIKQSTVSPQKPGTTPPKPSRQHSTHSRAEQQALFLEERSLQYKKAALRAKQEGKMELAKKYLRVVNGLKPMIEASYSGLPVDLTQVPPSLDSLTSSSKLQFMPTQTEGQAVGDREEMYQKLQQDLIQQIRTCTTNADHFAKLGDVQSASKLEKMLSASKKDLDSIKNAYKHGDPVPRFHYETRTFTLVQSNPDLGDNDVEVNVVRGINLALPSGFQPKDLDTYLQIEFPFPKDDPKKADSNTEKHTSNPEYNFVTKFQAERKSRTFLRVLNSKSIKLDIYYKRGFLKSDKVLGTANVKLHPLENVCVIHESFDLYDGRKAVGGKLEVKVRVRHPFIGKQVEETTEKWLVIDGFDRVLPSQKPSAQDAPAGKRQAPAPPAASGKPSAASVKPNEPQPEFNSLEVLKYEKQLLEQQIKRYQSKLTGPEKNALELKLGLIDKEINQTRQKVSSHGQEGLKSYVGSISKLVTSYQQEAKSLALAGNREKAQIMLTKKKLVEKEIEHFQARIASG